MTPTVTFARPPISLVSGSAKSISFETTLVCEAFCTSTTGLWPLTVRVSSSAPTRMSASTLAVNPDTSSMSSRLMVLKPTNVNVTT